MEIRAQSKMQGGRLISKLWRQCTISQANRVWQGSKYGWLCSKNVLFCYGFVREPWHNGKAKGTSIWWKILYL